MSSIERPLSGDVMRFDLERELEAVGEVGPGERSARTLVKEGPMRLTLVVLGAGGEIAEHRSDGPISVHAVRGDIEFTAGGATQALKTGDLVTAGAGVRHSVRSAEGGAFLLTVTRRA